MKKMAYPLRLLVPMLMICVSFGQTTDPSVADVTSLLHTTNPDLKGDYICDYADTDNDTSNESTTPHSIPLVESSANYGSCGYRSLLSKTTSTAENGTDFGEFPWYASLMTAKEADHENYFCNAVIIAPTVVLTSALCAEGASQEFFVQAGEWTRMDKTTNQRRSRRVVKYVIHQSYEVPWLGYDIALLIVESPFQWEEYVRPVCLPESTTKFDEAHCYFVNWRNDEPGLRDSQAVLKRVDAPIVPLDKCLVKQRQYQATFQFQHTDLCAGGNEEKNYDIFDSGSPLVCPEPGREERFFLVGISSRSPKKKDATDRTYTPRKVPKVYVSVPVLLEWLNDTLIQNGIESGDFTNSLYTTARTPNDDSIGGNPHTGSQISEKSIQPVDSPLRYENRDYPRVASVGPKSIDIRAEIGTDFGEFPWFATLMTAKEAAPENYFCCGVIIAPTVVLTNADCAKAAPEEFFVQAGEWIGMEKSNIQHRARRVEKVITHEEYDKKTLSNNIAILIMKSSFQWEEKIWPLCLPESNMSFDEARCYYINWTKDQPGRSGSEAILRAVNAPIVPLDQCMAKFRQYDPNSAKAEHIDLCAGSGEEKDYDIYSNGSPLVCQAPNAKDRFFLAGIVSYFPQGEDAEKGGYLPAGVPRAYVNIALQLQWLNDKLTQNGIDWSCNNTI